MSLVLTSFLFAGCGSAQPTGSLAECKGTRSFQETSGDGFGLNITGGYRIGQYVDVASGTIANAIMVRAKATGITQMKIGFWYGRAAEPSGTTDQLISEFTITKALDTPETQEIWLDLPQPFTFPELDNPVGGIYYFVVFTPIDGALVVPRQYVGESSKLRKGYRFGASMQWASSSTDSGIGIGYRTNSDCVSR